MLSFIFYMVSLLVSTVALRVSMYSSKRLSRVSMVVSLLVSTVALRASMVSLLVSTFALRVSMASLLVSTVALIASISTIDFCTWLASGVIRVLIASTRDLVTSTFGVTLPIKIVFLHVSPTYMIVLWCGFRNKTQCWMKC